MILRRLCWAFSYFERGRCCCRIWRNFQTVAARSSESSPFGGALEDKQEVEGRVYVSNDFQGYKGMQIVFLGTASSIPTATRNTSCIALRLEGTTYLFDCGEGAQKQFNELPFRQCGIDKIFITHMHGDHIFGLPGLLTGIGVSASKWKQPLEIYGPQGLRHWLRVSLKASYARIPTKYAVHELVLPKEKRKVTTLERNKYDTLHMDEMPGKEIYCAKDKLWKVFSDEKYTVKAGLLCHNVPCWGFVVEESPRVGRFLVERAEELGIHSCEDRALLVKGKHIYVNGEKINPSMVLGPQRKGRKVVILGDTYGSQSLKSAAYGADAIIHECTFLEENLTEAYKKKHSTASMAGDFARSVNASSLILTHFGGKFNGRTDRIASAVETAKRAFRKSTVIAASDKLALTIRLTNEVFDAAV